MFNVTPSKKFRNAISASLRLRIFSQLSALCSQNRHQAVTSTNHKLRPTELNQLYNRKHLRKTCVGWHEQRKWN